MGRFGPSFDLFGHLTRERYFSQICSFRREFRNIMFFHFKRKKYTSMVKNFVKTPKTHFGPILNPFCPKTRKSGLIFYCVVSIVINRTIARGRHKAINRLPKINQNIENSEIFPKCQCGPK